MTSTFEASTTVVDDISGTYSLDPTHTRIGFSARHAMVTTVRGSFKEFTSAITIDAANPANSSVRLDIAVASIDTGVADRDAHLRSGDFFLAEEFPQITFVSTAVVRDGDTWAITGDLTIKGITKSITIDFEQVGSARDPWGNLRVGFEGAAVISRKDWDLTWNVALDAGGILVSDKIKLEFDVSAVAAA